MTSNQIAWINTQIAQQNANSQARQADAAVSKAESDARRANVIEAQERRDKVDYISDKANSAQTAGRDLMNWVFGLENGMLSKGISKMNLIKQFGKNVTSLMKTKVG